MPQCRRRPVDPGVGHGASCRAIDTPVGRLGRGDQRAVLDAVHGRDEQPGPGLPASRSSRSPAVSPGRIGLGDDAEHRPGVQAGLDAERGRAGDLVAVQDGVLHRRRAAPGRQQREVQVDPAVRRHVERGRRQQRAVGDDGAAVDASSAQLGEEVRITGAARASAPATPASAASSATGDVRVARPRPAGAGGRVITATTSCRGASSSARSEGTAAAGVPAKASLTAVHRHSARPRVSCGLTFTVGAGSAPPFGLADRPHGRLRASGSSRSTNSTPSRWSVSCCRQRASVAVPSTVIGSPYMFCPCATTLAAAAAVEGQPGDRQAALRAVLLLVAREVQHRVDQVTGLLVVDVEGEHPQPDADLRRGEPGARRVQHRLGEVGDQGAQLLVEVGDRARPACAAPGRRTGGWAGPSPVSLRRSSCVAAGASVTLPVGPAD